jgi:6-phosphogluconolactonase
MATRILHAGGAAVRVYADADELAFKAAQMFARLADAYVLGNGRFTVVLSGGSTPRAMLQKLAQEPFASTVPWASIYFFWGDERCVAPDHADSNYRMAEEALLQHVPIPRENLFRIPAEQDDPHVAAEEYSETLHQFFVAGAPMPDSAPLRSVPRFDLIWLGLGTDGHTASLFPDTQALNTSKEIAVENYVEKLDAHRVTLAVPTLNNARNVTVLVSGADKAPILKQVLEETSQPQRYPAQLIKPANGTLLWMVDEAAASLLRE